MGTSKKTLTGTARVAALDRLVSDEFAKGTTLPDTRRAAASLLGGDASTYLGTVDPRYYRLLGLSTPLPTPPASAPYATKDGKASASLARAVAKRRASGVRWNVLAASIEATIGRTVSEPEARALAVRGGTDLDSSYVGRGTRVGAPATYADVAEAVEVA